MVAEHSFKGPCANICELRQAQPTTHLFLFALPNHVAPYGSYIYQGTLQREM